MLNCNKIISLVIALSLVTGLLGCAGPAQSSKAESVVSEESCSENSVVSEIVSEITSSEVTSAVEYVPRDRFEDANIINTVYTRKYLAENKLTNHKDIFKTSLDWINMFVKDNYKSDSPFNINGDYISGWSCHTGTFYNCDTDFSLMTYLVKFKTATPIKELTADSNGIYSFYLQLVMEEVEFFSEYILIGFVTNQTMQIYREHDFAEFLNIYSGYINLQVKKPVTPENIEAINLTELSNLDIRYRKFVIKDTIYVFGYEPCYWLYENYDYILKAYSVDDLHKVYEFHFPKDDDTYFDYGIDEDSLIIEVINDQETLFYRAAGTEIIQLSSSPYSETDTYWLSDTAGILENDDGDLLLKKDGKITMLFDGLPYKPDASADISYYTFRYRVNDTAFVYMNYGYEWLIKSGIYDIETSTDTVFSHENAKLLRPVAVGNNKVILAADEQEWYTSYGPYVYDAASGEITDLNWFNGNPDGYEMSFNLFGDVLLTFTKEGSGYVIRMCDLKNEIKPRIYQIFDSGEDSPLTVFETTNYLWFATDSFTHSDCYIYRMKSEG